MQIKSPLPITLTGNAETIIKDIHFKNITIETTGEEPIVQDYCSGVKVDNVELITPKTS
jgi:hypothetical protein